MGDDVQIGIQWLVEERDRLRGRVALLEDELVRRDEAESKTIGDVVLWVEVEDTILMRMQPGRESAASVRDYLVRSLSKAIVDSHMHRLQKIDTGALQSKYRLAFTGRGVDLRAMATR